MPMTEYEQERNDDARQLVDEFLTDRLLEHADRDEPDDLPLRVTQRHLRAHRAPERSSLDGDLGLAGEHGSHRLAGIVE